MKSIKTPARLRLERGIFSFWLGPASLATVIGHKDRVGPLRDYCTGLMLPCERKSVEPMAAVTATSWLGVRPHSTNALP